MSSTESEDVKEIMQEIGKAAKDAAQALVNAPADAKNRALNEAAASMRDRSKDILAANEIDMEGGAKKGLTAAMLDRLELNEERVEGTAAGLEAIAKLDDPVGSVMDSWDRPNGLAISRVRVPLGVIGVIYESRPNVTADAGGLCLKS